MKEAVFKDREAYEAHCEETSWSPLDWGIEQIRIGDQTFRVLPEFLHGYNLVDANSLEAYGDVALAMNEEINTEIDADLTSKMRECFSLRKNDHTAFPTSLQCAFFGLVVLLLGALLTLIFA